MIAVAGVRICKGLLVEEAHMEPTFQVPDHPQLSREPCPAFGGVCGPAIIKFELLRKEQFCCEETSKLRAHY
jgi:hypothetical protein